MTSWLPDNVASFGGEIDGVILLVYRIVGVWFLLAFGLLVYFAVRYRRREGHRAAYAPGRNWRSMAIVLVPSGLVLGFDLGIDAASTRVWDHVKRELPAAEQVVRITGKQYVWTFLHPGPDGQLDTADDISLENNLHIPVDTTIQFELLAEDVIHSFFLPNLRVKQDAVPGRTFRGWFRATQTGRYQIVCAELCGIGHTNMRGWLEVHVPSEYNAWMEEESGTAR